MGKFVIKKIDSGYFFNLKAPNGEIIATSEVYTTKHACLVGIESVCHVAPIAPTEDQTARNGETKTNPKFEVYTDKGGEFRFRLKARNGEIVAASEGYTQKVNCLHGIESVKKNVADAQIVEE